MSNNNGGTGPLRPNGNNINRGAISAPPQYKRTAENNAFYNQLNRQSRGNMGITTANIRNSKTPAPPARRIIPPVTRSNSWRANNTNNTSRKKPSFLNKLKGIFGQTRKNKIANLTRNQNRRVVF